MCMENWPRPFFACFFHSNLYKIETIFRFSYLLCQSWQPISITKVILAKSPRWAKVLIATHVVSLFNDPLQTTFPIKMIGTCSSVLLVWKQPNNLFKHPFNYRFNHSFKYRFNLSLLHLHLTLNTIKFLCLIVGCALHKRLISHWYQCFGKNSMYMENWPWPFFFGF